MNITYRNIIDLKPKFGKLLTYLHYSGHFEPDNISDRFVQSSFLDILENDEFDKFMSMSNEECLKELFPASIDDYLDISNDIGRLFWCGIQYINIFLNYRIPLRQIFLCLPLREMVKKYDIYHEMNEIELCRSFVKNEYQNVSILKYFRNKKNVSTRQLSILSGINEETIKSLERNNERFFKSSSNTLTVLSQILEIDPIFFKQKSSFLPCSHRLLTDKDFVTTLSIVIGDYYMYQSAPDLDVCFYRNKESSLCKVLLFVNGEPSIKVNNKEIPLDDTLLKHLLSVAVDRYLVLFLKNNLVF